MMVVAVIPARYASTRLPAKILADIHGKTMIEHVVHNVLGSRFVQRVIVATDDVRIQEEVKRFSKDLPVESWMTQADHTSGTDRMAEVAKRLRAENPSLDEIVFVNVQGDEPLLKAEWLDLAIETVVKGRFQIATLSCAVNSSEELENPNIVKVLKDFQDRAIYFSRFPIPFSRGEFLPPTNEIEKHIGVYVYRESALLEFSSAEKTELERLESLEQLRALKRGMSIGVVHCNAVLQGVDTLEDLEKVRRMIQNG